MCPAPGERLAILDRGVCRGRGLPDLFRGEPRRIRGRLEVRRQLPHLRQELMHGR